ncbi:MAG: hypothetical protein AAGA84_08040 [Pseudomonadota bacterium]
MDSAIATVDTQADLALAASLYRDSARTPAGFYVEPQAYPDRLSILFHVQQQDIGITALQGAVCSDDFAQALSWSSAAATARGYTTQLASTTTSDWFYQFDRSVNDNADLLIINRVYRCSAFAPADSRSAEFGVINRSPMSADALRFLAEYHWQFSQFNNSLHAVVSSSGRADQGAFEHELMRAHLVRGAGAGGCDRVSLWRWGWALARDTGVVRESQTFERSFDARNEAGSVSLCGG